MPEAYLRQGVLDHQHLDARMVESRGDAGIALCERRFRAKINLRGKPAKRFLDAVTAALGVPPPKTPNTTAASGETTVLWLGPDEWLVVGPPGREDAIAASLRDALDPGRRSGAGSITPARSPRRGCAPALSPSWRRRSPRSSAPVDTPGGYA